MFLILEEHMYKFRLNLVIPGTTLLLPDPICLSLLGMQLGQHYGIFSLW
jgi:hypothetical protein